MSDRCDEVRRSIADAGATPTHLDMLDAAGDAGDDGPLELALLAGEPSATVAPG